MDGRTIAEVQPVAGRTVLPVLGQSTHGTGAVCGTGDVSNWLIDADGSKNANGFVGHWPAW